MSDFNSIYKAFLLSAGIDFKNENLARLNLFGRQKWIQDFSLDNFFSTDNFILNLTLKTSARLKIVWIKPPVDEISLYLYLEEGSELEFYCLLSEGSSLKTNIIHIGNSSRSHQDIRLVSQKNLRTLIDSTVQIPNQIHNCKVNQSLKALSDNSSKVTLKPNLIIENNEVIATHSASVSTFDEYYLHYLESRGTNPKTTREILTKSFINPILEEL